MKILVLGASGYIGNPVARALTRAGHTVYGQTRAEEKAKALAAAEIIPIVAALEDTNTWSKVLPTIDTVIDIAGGLTAEQTTQITLQAVIAAAAARPEGSPKITYILTSAAGVHGDSRTEVVTDTTPITRPFKILAWRPAQDQRTINAPGLNGIVIRPTVVFGGSGSVTGMFFREAVAAKDEGRKISFAGTPGGRMPLIHVEDLADLFVKVVEKGTILGGTIFDASSDIVSIDDLLGSLASLTGAPGYEYRPTSNVFEEAIGATWLVQPYLGRSLLGWYPKKPSLVDGLQVYFDAALASS